MKKWIPILLIIPLHWFTCGCSLYMALAGPGEPTCVVTSNPDGAEVHQRNGLGYSLVGHTPFIVEREREWIIEEQGAIIADGKVVFVSARHGDPSFHVDVEKNGRDMKDPYVQQILLSNVIPGMTESDVGKAWGPSDRARTITVVGGEHRFLYWGVWGRTTRRMAHFVDGKVVATEE